MDRGLADILHHPTPLDSLQAPTRELSTPLHGVGRLTSPNHGQGELHGPEGDGIFPGDAMLAVLVGIIPWGNASLHRGIVMAVKLIDLQIIYGLAGAREAFENLAFDLIKSQESRAQKVRVSQGDGGIDAHVNDLSDPGGVHVYQCKFFREGLEDSQKGQIRDQVGADVDVEEEIRKLIAIEASHDP